MKLNNDIAFNIAFWSLYFLYQWLGLASLYMDYDKYFINACMALPVSLLFSIVTVHVFFKRLYLENRKTLVWFSVMICSAMLIMARRYINYYLIYPKYFPQATWMPFFSFGKLLIEFVNLYVVTGLYGLYYFMRSWYQERNKAQLLLQQHTMAELDLLKAQVQPHFVFNTLNNIYSTALKDSPETADLIVHLSGFLDYNLYDASQDFVLMTAELNYLKHYIELEKNRYGDKLDVSLTIQHEMDDIKIAPLLLLPLLENCFKHGVADAAGQRWVRLDISRQGSQICIRIENSKEPESSKNSSAAGGIGLANVKKRLHLIYPVAHSFEITEHSNTYLVILKLHCK